MDKLIFPDPDAFTLDMRDQTLQFRAPGSLRSDRGTADPAARRDRRDGAPETPPFRLRHPWVTLVHCIIRRKREATSFQRTSRSLIGGLALERVYFRGLEVDHLARDEQHRVLGLDFLGLLILLLFPIHLRYKPSSTK